MINRLKAWYYLISGKKALVKARRDYILVQLRKKQMKAAQIAYYKELSKEYPECKEYADELISIIKANNG